MLSELTADNLTKRHILHIETTPTPSDLAFPVSQEHAVAIGLGYL